jgi:ferritin-like metal-binding protein YciE
MPKGNSTAQKQKTKKKSKADPSNSGKAIKTLEDAFIHGLSNMRNAEQQLTKALPKMAKAVDNADLAKAFETHLKETEQQIELIDKAIQSCGVKLKRAKCDAMEALIEEGKEIIQKVNSGPVRDTMLIAAGQKVEHYEIASYGCLVSAAEQLGFTEAAQFLDRILDQEKQTDRKLNQLAEQRINEDACLQESTQKGNSTMARYNQGNNGGRRGRMPQRDEEGRFMSDDSERDYGRGGRDYNDYNDDNRSSRSSQDEDYDDEDNYSAQDRDEDYEDNRSSSRSGSGRGHGGWFGDSEGHSQAARQRGQGGNYRSSSRDDRYYDDNRSSRSDGRGRGHGGWFGDSEGHAEAARQRDSGFRSSSRSGGGGSRSDYSSRSSGRGQGGWFGDSQGHAEAAQRGWDDRR